MRTSFKNTKEMQKLSETHQWTSRTNQMDDQNISKKLEALAKGKNRSNTAKLREIFEQVETALYAGALRADVYLALKGSGFSFTFESFELAIYRIRKERSSKPASLKLSPTSGVSPPIPVAESPQLTTGFHKVLEEIAANSKTEDPRRN